MNLIKKLISSKLKLMEFWVWRYSTGPRRFKMSCLKRRAQKRYFKCSYWTSLASTFITSKALALLRHLARPRKLTCSSCRRSVRLLISIGTQKLWRTFYILAWSCHTFASLSSLFTGPTFCSDKKVKDLVFRPLWKPLCLHYPPGFWRSNSIRWLKRESSTFKTIGTRFKSFLWCSYLLTSLVIWSTGMQSFSMLLSGMCKQ